MKVTLERGWTLVAVVERGGYVVIADHQNAGKAVKVLATQIRKHFAHLAQT